MWRLDKLLPVVGIGVNSVNFFPSESSTTLSNLGGLPEMLSTIL